MTRRRLRRWLAHRGLRFLMLCHGAAVLAARRLGRGRRPPGRPDGHVVLLTGSFQSDNWISAHLRPLAASVGCARAVMVAAHPVPPLENVEAVYPPRVLTVLLGAVPARLLTFFWTAVRRRPDLVAGFHLLLNGLAAAVVGPLVGARSLYFCVGGVMEVVDGGIHSENRLFASMETPDPVVERRLLRAVASFDVVVTMGSGAVRYFRQRGVTTAFHVVPGGIDRSRYRPSSAPPEIDVILVARLAPIKRVDVFLEALALVARQRPSLSAVVVGEGPQRTRLEELARERGLSPHVHFAGHRRDVEDWLRRARLLALTSDSEGLPLSVMEGMSCGLPAVVSGVGDLADLVEDGINGHLVHERTPQAFAAEILGLLDEPERRRLFSQAARESAQRFEMSAVARLWEQILAPQAPGRLQ